MDKATFLQQTVEYIKQLQAVMHQLLAMGAIKNLPEETQWSIRLLLPRKKEEVTIPAPTPAPVQMPGNQMAGNQQMGNQMGGGMTNQASSGMLNSAQFLPYMLQQQAQPQQSMMTQSSMQVSHTELSTLKFQALRAASALCFTCIETFVIVPKDQPVCRHNFCIIHLSRPGCHSGALPLCEMASDTSFSASII